MRREFHIAFVFQGAYGFGYWDDYRDWIKV
jgi:hypothetical protein